MTNEESKINNTSRHFNKKSINAMLMGALIFLILYIAQSYNFLMFHVTVEMMSVIPSFMVFVIVVYVWQHLENNNFLSFLGIAFFFTGIIDFTHMLAYEGMPIFYGFDSDLPIQLWILARYVQVISILVASLLIKFNKQINKYIVFAIYSAIVSVAFWMIFVLRVFPHCFIEGYGLTTFKIVSEYIISIGLMISAIIIWRNKEFFSGNIVKLLMLSIVAQIISELFFTSYGTLYAFSNFLGHYFKVIYIILFFGAIIETALASPSKLLYLDLLKRELELKEINLVLNGKINELANTQQSLMESEGRLRSVFQCMTEGFSIQEVICDDEGKLCDLRFLEANAAFELQTGLSYEKTVGFTILELFPDTGLHWIQRYGTVGLTGEPINFVERFGHLNKYYQVSAFQTGPRKIGVLFTDINKHKQAELETIKAKEAAEAANAAKSQFLANMSHEIRTPMNGVMGMIQLMQMTELTDKQKEFLNISKISSDALLVVVNDILDYSKIEAGKMGLEKINFDLNKVVNDVMSLFKSSVMKKGLKMEVFIDSDVPINLVGDPFKLRQIISNLIGNAVKYTDKGSIDVSVKKIEDIDTCKIKLQFIIKDTGIGIPMDKKYVIFKSFSQVDNSDTRKYGGTGLGLAISKSLVELMDGEIYVKSIDGDGSSFYFTCVLERLND